MAGIKISELPEASDVSGDELIPIIQNNCTKVVKASEIKGNTNGITGITTGCGLAGGGKRGVVNVEMDNNCFDAFAGTYTTVQTNSGDWDQSGCVGLKCTGRITCITTGAGLCGGGCCGTVNVSYDSACTIKWNGAYSTVQSSSASWEGTYSTMQANSATWEDTTSTLAAFSATYVSHTAQSLTEPQQEQARENIGAVNVPSGPYTDQSAANLAGINLGTQWHNDTGQVYIMTLDSSANSYFSSFTSSISEQRQISVSHGITKMKEAGLWNDVISFYLFGTAFNSPTQGTIYPVVGNTITTFTDDPGPINQTSPHSSAGGLHEFGNPDTVNPLEKATSISWSSPLGTIPTAGLLAGVESVPSTDGGMRFWWDGAGLKAQSIGGLTQDILLYSPTTSIGSLGPSIFGVSIDPDINEVRYYLNDDAPFVQNYPHGDTGIDLIIRSFSDDVAYHGDLIYNRVLTDAEHTTLNTIINDHFFLKNREVIVDGDSILAGSVVPRWYDQVEDEPANVVAVIDNNANGGDTTTMILANALTGIQGAPALSDGAEGYFIFNGGVNDLSSRIFSGNTSGNSNQDIFDRLVDIAAVGRAQGLKSVVQTLNKSGSGNAEFNTAVDAINSMLRADTGTNFDGVIDLDATLAAYDSEYYNNSAVYSDNIHPYTTQGQTLVADAWGAFFQAV